MANIVNKIGYAMSLREPQKEALSYLAAISENCNYQTDDKSTVEKVATQYCEGGHTIKVAKAFDFPSFCFDMATGIGKTRLMGATIYYLYKTKGYKHFFILAPGNTIYDKLRKEAQPSHPKYIFKGLEAEMGVPRVFDGENYLQYNQQRIEIEKSSDIQLFIFNISKIFTRGDVQFKFHKFQEMLGASFADILAGFDDLVVCMDEAHRYYAPQSMKAINYLQPVLGLEFTATPKDTNHNIIYTYDLAKGAGKYLKIPVVMGRTNTAGYSAEDIEEMKIRDGLTLHENRKRVVRQYCSDHDLEYVKPIVLIACRDTEHAKRVRALIDSDSFYGGKYRNKVIEIHSNMSGEETEDNIKKLLSIESSSNPIEIVLHVYKLKEGWDVNNLFTIIPLNAAKSDILALQTIGRGLRLPFGFITGNEDIDTLDIVAHDHYRELIDEVKNSDVFRHRNLDDDFVEETELVQVSAPVSEGQVSLFDDLFTQVQVPSYTVAATDEEVQDRLYESYLKSFAPKKERATDNGDMQLSLFDPVEDTVTPAIVETPADTATDAPVKPSTGKPIGKKEFVEKIREYSAKAVAVPKVAIQVSSTFRLSPFVVKRTIADFDLAASRIERFDTINKQLLASFDAEMLGVDDALNTLACMLLDQVSELSVDDAEYILDIVSQYLDTIDASEDDKKKIVRRYAVVIIDDIKRQIYAHAEVQNQYIYSIERNLIVFKPFVKNMKKDGRVPFKKPFTDASNIKKYLFTGYKKSYYPENVFDSDAERIFSIILEEDAEVIRWIRPPANQLGIFWQAGQQYTPDFLVETANGKYMVEIQDFHDAERKDVLAKAKEGVKWCQYATLADPDKKAWAYRLITDNNIAVGNSCSYTLGTARIITEE